MAHRLSTIAPVETPTRRKGGFVAALSDEILVKIEEATGFYHRLILIAGTAGSGKTAILQELAERTHYPRINLNLALSSRLLDLTERQRALQILRLCDEIMMASGNDVVLLDNIEILFDTRLRQHPLHLLQSLARNRTIVAAWNGLLTRPGGRPTLSYATSDHPEYQKFTDFDAIVVELPQAAETQS